MAGLTDLALRLPPRRTTDGPRVSIIMPTFRRAHQISQSIRSLLTGEYQDFELLVRDDGDEAEGAGAAVREAAAGDSRVSYHINDTNLGIARNLNEGIRVSGGEFISVCHDHDLYRAGFLKAMVAALDRYPSALYVHCGSEVISQQGEHKRTNQNDFAPLTPGASWLKYMLSTPNCPVCALTLVRRTAHERHGLYNPTYGFLTDIEMWMRLSQYGDVAYVAKLYLLLREREADHYAVRNADEVQRILARIHSAYIPLAYRGVKRLKASLRLQYWSTRTSLIERAHSLKAWAFGDELGRVRTEGA